MPRTKSDISAIPYNKHEDITYYTRMSTLELVNLTARLIQSGLSADHAIRLVSETYKCHKEELTFGLERLI